MSLELIASNGWQLQKVYFQFISRVNCPWIEASKYIGVVSSPYQNIWIIQPLGERECLRDDVCINLNLDDLY